MASIPSTDSMALRQSIEVSDDLLAPSTSKHPFESKTSLFEMPLDQRAQVEKHQHEHAMREAGEPPSKDNCDGKHEGHDPSITISSTSKLAGQTVAPFLAKHIPEQYAPLGTKPRPSSSQTRDPNTKYCYRHRPDSKCRRTADEPSMENLQRVCCLPTRESRLLTSDSYRT